jgi:hypothetical protein
MFWYEQLSAHEALEAGHNPIVGDPDRIAQLATDLTGTADALRVQNQRLRAVRSEQFWKGDAATAFDAYKEQLPPLLDKVIERYTVVGSALAGYHPQLRAAQQLAARALRDYAAAKGAHQLAQNALQQQQALQQQAAQRQQAVRAATGPTAALVQQTPAVVRQQQELAEQQRVLLTRTTQQVTTAQDGMQAAIREMAQAIEERTHAAANCAGAINHASHDDLANTRGGRRPLGPPATVYLDRLESQAPALRAIGGQLSVAALALGAAPGSESLTRAAIGVNSAALIADAALATYGRNVSTTQVVADATGVASLNRLAQAAGGLQAQRTVTDLRQAAEYVTTTAASTTDPGLKATLTQAGAALTSLTHDPGAAVRTMVRDPAGLTLPTADPATVAGNATAYADQHPEVVRTLARITVPVR